jgi:HEPN domain-containing protein
MTKRERGKLLQYWIKSAEEDWDAYNKLRSAKKYAHALFFMHLSIEKLLKAIIVLKIGDHAPYSHSLSFLLGKSGIDGAERFADALTEMSKFNMQTRYPDEKLEFYASIDHKTSLYWHKIALEIRTWLLSFLKES